jgi:hypothetical protein
MSSYYVSVTVTRAADVDDETLMRMFRDAAEHAVCFALEVTPAGMVIEAEPANLTMLEWSLRDLLHNGRGRLESISVARV